MLQVDELCPVERSSHCRAWLVSCILAMLCGCVDNQASSFGPDSSELSAALRAGGHAASKPRWDGSDNETGRRHKPHAPRSHSSRDAACDAQVPDGAAATALVLIDRRLYTQLNPLVDSYVNKASAARGFKIDMRVIDGIDDWAFGMVRSYLQAAKAEDAQLEGVLFIGNIKLPSFYKTRNDIVTTRIWPHYYEDLDGVYGKRYADGAIDPDCSMVPAGELQCAVGGPVTVPAHDFDYQAKGPNPGPELWFAQMPVGVRGAGEDYGVYGDQLRAYLVKLNAFYDGQISSNGRYYFVSNDVGERFDETWDAFGRTRIDFFGKPGPNGETGAACLTGTENVCYRRWPTEQYADAQAFLDAYRAQPWVDEGWQQDSVFIGHMNAATYDAVEVNVHSTDVFSLASAEQVRELRGAGLFVALDGCGVGGFAQPGSPSNVDNPGTFVSDNVLLAYLYGRSTALAGSGNPSWRGHYGHFPYMYRAMKLDGDYLGKAHLRRMQRLYELSGDSWYELRENTGEYLVGDPFLRL